ncbi:MAG: nitronate monooxygenase [Actinomycetota bacterium]|jgi:enoyl-[acyl-carrier protein] reductase II|nr:nitronate monooxygenase [Actinomycetota bacterium]MDQ1503329.1 nitronate monooxygenase [Actinomycetota bacterium]
MAMDRRALLKLLATGAAGLGATTVLGPWTGTPAVAAPAPAGDPPAASLRTRLTERYGVAYPIVQAGMAFYATPALAAAVTNAGGLGVLGPVPEGPEGTRRQIRETRGLTPGPFGVDFVYFPFFHTTPYGPGGAATGDHPARNATWSITDAHVDVLIEEHVDFVVWFWTDPEPRWVKRLRDARIPQWAQVGTVDGARRALGYGAEVIIAQGKQAGGHSRGFQDGEPLHRSELVPLVRNAVGADTLVLAAGGIADGRTLADALAEGADGGWVGTRFAVSAESYAHEEYMRRVIAVKDGYRETIPTGIFGPEFGQAYTRSIVNRVLAEWKGQEDKVTTPPPPPPVIGTARLQPWTVPGGIPYAMPKFSVIIPTRDTTGDFDEMCLLAGAESSPLVTSVQPAAAIVAEMASDAARILNPGRLAGPVT